MLALFRPKHVVNCDLTTDKIYVVIDRLDITSIKTAKPDNYVWVFRGIYLYKYVPIFVGLMFSIMTVAVSYACELNAERKENPRCLKMESESSPVSSAPRPPEYGRPATPLLASLWPAQPWRVALRPNSLPIHTHFSMKEKFG